jgi:hypothetical protein
LKNPEKSPILVLMNAVEVIEEIRRLPEEEREKVVEFVRHLPNAETIEAINEPLEGLPRPVRKAHDYGEPAMVSFVTDYTPMKNVSAEIVCHLWRACRVDRYWRILANLKTSCPES